MVISLSNNPVTRRVDGLRQRWLQFTDQAEARLAVWRMEPDDLQMLDVFIEIESDEIGECPDLFIKIELPFDTDYGHQVVREIDTIYRDTQGELADEEGFDLNWVMPPSSVDESDVAALVRIAADFADHHSDFMDHVAVVFLPNRIKDRAAWVEWLQAVITCDIPENLRFLALDLGEALDLSLFEKQPHPKVVHEDMRLMSGDLANELAAAAGGTDSGSIFRRHLLAVSSSGRKGKLGEARKSATHANAIAVEEGWHGMRVVVQMNLASACTGQGDHQGAIDAHLEAVQAADEAKQAEAPEGDKLVVQTRLALGAAYITMEDYSAATLAYGEAATLADGQSDHFCSLEGWRMTAYCQEVQKQWQPSWNSGWAGIRAAEAMEAEQRQTSTLPFLGVALLRVVAADPELADKVDELRAKMDDLAGPEWERKGNAEDVPS